MTPPNWEDTFQDGQTFEPKVIDRLKQLGSSGVQSVSAADSSITIGGTASDPTIAVAGGGSSAPPVEYVGTDPTVNQVTVKGAVDQSGSPLTYILQVVDSDGNFYAGFDFSGALDLAQGLHAASDPTTGLGFQVAANGSVTIAISSVDALKVANDAGTKVAGFNTSGSGVNVLEIDPRADVIPLDINSFGGSQPAIRYLGAPDFNGEFMVLQGGAVVIGQHTAPADGELVAGQLALWFDDTDGAGKLKIKAKTANGTVVAGSVNLT